MSELHDKIIALNKQGKTRKEIKKLAQCGGTTITRCTKKYGLTWNSIGSRNFNIKSNIFNNLTEESAYWLGFILADGCLTRQNSNDKYRGLKVSIQLRDFNYLKKLGKFLGYKGKYYDDKRDGHIRKILRFNDVKLIENLINIGWQSFKDGSNTDIMDYVGSYFNHFLRGYYDGDGGISNNKDKKKTWYCYIVTPHGLHAKYIQSKLNINSNLIKQDIFRVNINGSNNVKSFLEWLYKDATIYMDRKYARYQEFINRNSKSYSFKSLHSFKFDFDTKEFSSRLDQKEIITQFKNSIMSYGWSNPKYDFKSDLDKLKSFDYKKHITDDGFDINKSIYGNKFILNDQPVAWSVSTKHGKSITQFQNQEGTVDRALKNFFYQKDTKKLNPPRLIRELLFAGFTKASLLSTSFIMAVIDKLQLKGKWFDPCAGWGNRLLAAHLLDINYVGTDPGISYPGLERIKKHLNAKAILHNLKFQDILWPKSDFVFTSPPFWDKEDYLDNAEYGKFSEWIKSFMIPLIERSKQHSKRVVFHLDNEITEAISKAYNISKYPIKLGSRNKVSKEWIVEVL